MSRIDNAQTDYTMRPLNSFLFDCQFHSPNEGDLVFPTSTLKKLAYSVKAVKIPKMKPDSEVKSIQYGSFFVSFPFFSTGEKEMTITFYETDDMLISKVFYAMQAKHRWKPYAIYNNTTNVDLIVDVNIHDQHNKLKFNEYSLFHNTYSLVLESISPPRFSRTGTVQLLTVDATFNAVEFETEEFDRVTRRSAGFNAEDEMNKTIEEGGLDRAPDAAGSMEDIQKRLKEFEEAAAKLAGKFEQDSVGYDKNLPTHALDLGENTTFVTRAKDGSKVVMSVVDTKVVTEGGKDRKVQFLDGSNYDQSKLKPQHTTSWVFHMQGAYQADLGTTLKNESTEGVFATSDREGNWAANLDQAYKSNTAANSRGEAFQSYAAIELPGAVALYKGDDGKYYERVATGVKGVEYREISEAKFKEVAGDEYTTASMEGNKNLEDSYSKAINNEKSAVAADGSVVKVKFTNVYDNKVTDEELYKMESLGRAMATRDEFNYSEEELSNMKAVSHGMLDSSSGKLEGLPSRNRKLLDALVKGLRR